MLNVHTRAIDAPPRAVGELLETLGSEHDAFWRHRLGFPVELDRGLEVGSRGGHEDVRYHVVEHEPGRRVVFRFEPPTGLEGTHAFEVLDGPDGTALLRHTLAARPTGAMRLLVPLVVEAVHDLVAEDVLDHVERTLTGRAHRVQRPPLRALALARFGARRPVELTAPPRDGLLVGALARVDAGERFATPLRPGDSRDVDVWRGALLGSPWWMRVLVRLRDRLGRLVGLEPSGGGTEPFPELARTDSEILLGLDDRHLDFRVSVRVEDTAASISTVVLIHNAFGRAYWSVVRWFHPVLVRATVRRVRSPLGDQGAGARGGEDAVTA